MNVPIIEKSQPRRGQFQPGSEHPRWNKGKLYSSHGYALVRVGISHPEAMHQGYAYEHRLVWLTAHGKIPKDREIHHRNGDKSDNRIENLELVKHNNHPKARQ
jgi:hypothetical protein